MQTRLTQPPFPEHGHGRAPIGGCSDMGGVKYEEPKEGKRAQTRASPAENFSGESLEVAADGTANGNLDKTNTAAAGRGKMGVTAICFPTCTADQHQLNRRRNGAVACETSEEICCQPSSGVSPVVSVLNPPDLITDLLTFKLGGR